MPQHGNNRRYYNANIIGAIFGTASTGNEQIAIQCEITDGDEAGTVMAYVGTFTDKSFEYTEKAMRACGWKGDDLREFQKLADAGKLGPVNLTVDDEEYEGKTRARISFINEPGGGRFKFKEGSEIVGAGLDAFAARMKAAFRSGPRPPTSGKPAQRQAGGGDGGPPGTSRRGGFVEDDREPPIDDGRMPWE